MTACARLGCGHSKSMHDTGWDAAGCMFSACGCGAYEAPTTPDTPATEAGRALLAAGNGEDPILPDDWLGSILAIEAEARSVPTRPAYQPNGLPVPPEADPADWPPDVPTRPDEPLVTPVTEEEHGWHICEACVHVSEPLTVERLAAALDAASHRVNPDGSHVLFPSDAPAILAALGIGDSPGRV